MEMSYREGSGGGGSLKDMDYMERDTCSSPRAKIFLVMTVSFVIAAVVVLVVILTRIESTPYVQPDDTSPTCPDVAIVGGGLAGTFITWKLRNQNLTLNLYEKSPDHLGGRIRTVRFSNASNIPLELGAVYFIQQLHQRLANLTQDLGLEMISAFLKSTNMTEYELNEEGKVVDIEEELMYFIRGRKLRYQDIGNSDKLPYNLMDRKEKGRTPMQLLRETLQSTIAVNTGDVPSYDQELDTRSALFRHMSKEAYNLIMDTAWPGEVVEEGGASQLLDYVNALESGDVTLGDLVTVPGGMQTLIDSMVDEIEDKRNNIARISISKDHQLYKIENNLGIYRLYFKGTHHNDRPVYCAHQVVLALPPEAIRSLEWQDHESELKKYLDTVIPIPASKLFLQYNTTWWPLNATTVQTDTALGQLQYLGADPETNATVLQAMYTADEHYGYWKKMVDMELGIDGDVQRLTNQTPPPYNEDEIFHQWEAAWHVWKPNVDWLKISDQMIRPVSEEMVYVIGSSFAPGYLSKWMEGALMTAEQVLGIILKNI